MEETSLKVRPYSPDLLKMEDATSSVFNPQEYCPRPMLYTKWTIHIHTLGPQVFTCPLVNEKLCLMRKELFRQTVGLWKLKEGKAREQVSYKWTFLTLKSFLIVAIHFYYHYYYCFCEKLEGLGKGHKILGGKIILRWKDKDYSQETPLEAGPKIIRQVSFSPSSKAEILGWWPKSLFRFFP